MANSDNAATPLSKIKREIQLAYLDHILRWNHWAQELVGGKEWGSSILRVEGQHYTPVGGSGGYVFLCECLGDWLTAFYSRTG